MNLYRITEFNYEKPVVLIVITLYYLCLMNLYLGNPPFSNPDSSASTAWEYADLLCNRYRLG